MGYRHLDIESTTFSAFQIVKWIERGDLDIEWYTAKSNWNLYKNSKLIESIILDIPIPAIYLSEEGMGSYIALDGQKRLHALNQYVNNRYELTGLTILEGFERDFFKNLPAHIQRKILDYEFHFYVLRQYGDPMIRFEILERVNAECVNLKAQALRNLMYADWTITSHINQLAEHEYLRKIIDAMAENEETQMLIRQELVSKFIAFYMYREQFFKTDLKWMLNDIFFEMSSKRGKYDHFPSDELEIELDYVITNIFTIFGEYFLKNLNYHDREVELLDILFYGFLIVPKYNNLENLALKIRPVWKNILLDVQQSYLTPQGKKEILVKWLKKIENVKWRF